MKDGTTIRERHPVIRVTGILLGLTCSLFGAAIVPSVVAKTLMGIGFLAGGWWLVKFFASDES